MEALGWQLKLGDFNAIGVGNELMEAVRDTEPAAEVSALHRQINEMQCAQTLQELHRIAAALGWKLEET